MRFEESRAHIVDEKFPVSLCPFQPLTLFASCDPVETHAMRGDEIEFFAEVGQRLLGIDSRDDTANTEELRAPAEERFVIGIESEPVVAKRPAEIQEISGTAA